MCCGHGRRQLHTMFSGKPAGTERSTPAHIGSMFEYVGTTGLTVVGPSTGARYRFERSGARLSVDVRDHAGLARIPVLRHVG